MLDRSSRDGSGNRDVPEQSGEGLQSEEPTVARPVGESRLVALREKGLASRQLASCAARASLRRGSRLLRDAPRRSPSESGGKSGKRTRGIGLVTVERVGMAVEDFPEPRGPGSGKAQEQDHPSRLAVGQAGASFMRGVRTKKYQPEGLRKQGKDAESCWGREPVLPCHLPTAEHRLLVNVTWRRYGPQNPR